MPRGLSIIVTTAVLPAGWADDSESRPAVEVMVQGDEVLAFINPDSKEWE